jgi:hypothetical protein
MAATKKTTSRPKPAKKAPSDAGSSSDASQRIDARIKELGDWRGQMLQRVRRIILSADPAIVEQWKWDNPVWACDGILCTGETYKKIVKLTFPRGASLNDPAGLFNSSLEGKVRRAIDLPEDAQINESALRDLIRAAIALNRGHAAPATAATPKLLSGGNPQIAKADGDSAVQAYIAAMPGWKQDVGRWLDELITRTIPNVRKAVRWNTPFYGIEGQGWFVGFHCITKYVKVAFFKGAHLRPPPPVESKQKDVRYYHIHETDPRDEKLVSAWMKQAAALPGEKMF